MSVKNGTLNKAKAGDDLTHMEETIAYLEEKHSASISFVVCGSAGANIKARPLLSEKHPHLFVDSCKAHQVNLVVKDVLGCAQFSDTCKAATKIVSHFPQIPTAHGNRRQQQIHYEKRTIAISKPTDTRWYSYYNSYKAIQDSKRSLRVKLSFHTKAVRRYVVVFLTLGSCCGR